jgi:hypothetical protein
MKGGAKARRIVLMYACVSGAACGEQAAPAAAAPAAQSGGAELADFAPRQGMQVEGILGTIPQTRIERVLQEKLPQFQRCFFEGSGDIPALAGAVKFYFHVDLSGAVEWVIPRQSNVGHRGTELCLLSHAKHTKFPAPRGGGPAEFSWGFELEQPEGVHRPTVWEPDHVADVLVQHRSEIVACASQEPGEYDVTTYIAPGGSVLSAGAAVHSEAAAQHVDCILATVRSWQFPDPGSEAAKVSFRL